MTPSLRHALDFGDRILGTGLVLASLPADAAHTLEVDTLAVGSIAGYTASRTITLPAVAAVGDRCGIALTTGDDTYQANITAASGDTLNGVAGGTTWGNVCLLGELLIFRCTTANSAWVVEYDGRIERGYISRSVLTWTSVTAIGLEAGSAIVADKLLTWSALSWSGTAGVAPLDAEQIVYVYVYDNSGTPTLDASTTVPVWDSTRDAYYKTGVPQRRYVGWFRVNDDAGTKEIMQFVGQADSTGRSVDQVQLLNSSTELDITLVSSGTATTTTQQSLSVFVPKFATHWLVNAKMIFTNDGDEFTACLHPSTQTGLTALTYSLFTVRVKIGGASGRMFPGRFWMPNSNSASPEFYWGLFNTTGTGTVDIDCHGARIYR